ncbi:hypothetical protein Ancab_025928 [Ancistrocladus abbreviatus]
MELLLEFVLTVSLSFMFTFLITKLISMKSAADDFQYDHSELKSGTEYLIGKAAINEHYFGARSRSKPCDDEVEEVMKADRFQRVSLQEEQIKFAECAIEGRGSVQLFHGNSISEAAVGEDNCKEIMVVELDENINEFNLAEFSGGGMSSVEEKDDFEGREFFDEGSTTSGRERRRYCLVEIELVEDEFGEAKKGKRVEEIEVLDCERDRPAIELDDWETIEKRDLEEALGSSEEVEIGKAKI